MLPLILVLATMLCSCGQGFDFVPGAPSGPISGNDFRHRLELIEDEKTSTRPEPYHYQVFVSERETVLNVAVELHFEYFNDDLMQLDVYPISADDIGQLNRAINDFQKESRAAGTPSCVEVEVKEDGARRRYLSITNLSVQEELRRWIRRYS